MKATMTATMTAKIYGTPYAEGGEVIGRPCSYRTARNVAWRELSTRDQMVIIYVKRLPRWKFRLDDNLNMIAIH